MALTIAAPAGATVALGETIAVGGWRGGEEFAVRDNAFVRCAIVRGFPGGISLSFAITAERMFVIALGDPDWEAAAERQSPPLRLRFDGSGPFAANYDIGERGVEIPFDAWADLASRLRQAGELTIALGDLSTTVPLTGTSSALPALERCADRHR